MRDIYQIRRENLNAVVEARFKAKRPKLAEMLGFSQPSLLSRYLTGKPEGKKDEEKKEKKIGASLARKIESKLGLPHGWMDIAHTSTPHVSDPVAPYDLITEAEIADIVALLRRLTPAFRAHIRMTMEDLLEYIKKYPFLTANMQPPTQASHEQFSRNLVADMERLRIGRRRSNKSNEDSGGTDTLPGIEQGN